MSWKGTFSEGMVKCLEENSLKEFRQNLHNFPEVEKLINTPISDILNTDYKKYLTQSAYLDEEKTLLDAMMLWEALAPYYSDNHFEIVYSEDKIPLGWIHYNIALKSKVNFFLYFPFEEGNTIVLQKAKDTIDKLVEENTSLCWSTFAENPLINYYLKWVFKYNGTCHIDDNGFAEFLIDKSISKKELEKNG